MKALKSICVIYGGMSGEHDVSLKSAASVIKHLDSAKYSVSAIGIDKLGRWHLQSIIKSVSVPGEGDALSITTTDQPVSIVPSDGIHTAAGKLEIDCVFPVLHGTFGEDGKIQGLLEVAGLPYVGAGVLGSAASMDKEAAKRLWRDSGLPIVDFAVIRRTTPKQKRVAMAEQFGFPIFVKPCSAGSSLGASRVDSLDEMDAAIERAFEFDTRVLIERHIDAREIECAVIGNAAPHAYIPGEIETSANHMFYDYAAKYTDPNGAKLVDAANLDAVSQERIMRIAEMAYSAVRCEGMARVDFFLERDTGEIFLNEINTIPGFTNISMFPRMCEASGLPYRKLLDTLIELALAKAEETRTLRYVI